jgi:hypothetical protein
MMDCAPRALIEKCPLLERSDVEPVKAADKEEELS